MSDASQQSSFFATNMASLRGENFVFMDFVSNFFVKNSSMFAVALELMWLHMLAIIELRDCLQIKRQWHEISLSPPSLQFCSGVGPKHANLLNTICGNFKKHNNAAAKLNEIQSIIDLKPSHCSVIDVARAQKKWRRKSDFEHSDTRKIGFVNPWEKVPLSPICSATFITSIGLPLLTWEGCVKPLWKYFRMTTPSLAAVFGLSRLPYCASKKFASPLSLDIKSPFLPSFGESVAKN